MTLLIVSVVIGFFINYFPVLPKPPSPLSESERNSDSIKFIFGIFINTNCPTLSYKEYSILLLLSTPKRSLISPRYPESITPTLFLRQSEVLLTLDLGKINPT